MKKEIKKTKKTKKTKKIKRLKKRWLVWVSNPEAIFEFKSIKSTIGFIEGVLRLHPSSEISVKLK